MSTLLPSILGLAFARAGLIAACYGSYENTDEGLFTDGAMLVSLMILLIPFLMIVASKKPIGKTWTNRIARFCIVAEVATICAIGATNLLDPLNVPVRFALSVACTTCASGAIFYWLRRMRGSIASVSALFVFGALIVSEIELFITAYLPGGVDCFLTAALACLQLAFIPWARKSARPQDAEEATPADSFFGSSEEMLRSRAMLITLALAIGLFSVVTGFLRGYPDGSSIPFQTPTRIGYALLTIVASVGIIAFVFRSRTRVMSRVVFTVIELLACATLICYAAFPGALDVGAMFVTSLNAIMVGFTWYIIVAFMSYGWRDPYYYAIAGWLVWLGARAGARMALFAIQPLSANDPVFIAVMGTILVLGEQAVSKQFLRIERMGATQENETTPKTIVRIMGLDSNDSLADMQRNAMRHSAEIVGEQFLLSEREVDVLALYALGFTQKRVAEELFITQSTAHAHIKRIYAKTGMHSRQEIIDYINEFAS